MSDDFKRVVEHVARLARLDLSEEEMILMADQLDAILETARRIQQVDTRDVEPTSHVVNLPAVLRDDEVRPSLSPDMTLQNAPRRENGYFRVPRILG